jgi:NaMN:DMB phosphoribosyltransferase
MDNPHAAVFVGNHGIARLGVSAYPMEVTAQMHQNYLHGGAGFNTMCRAVGVSYDIYDIEIDRPTEDFTKAPAMSEADLVAALNVGLSAVKPGMSVFCPGEMGIGNTASAAAVLAACSRARRRNGPARVRASPGCTCRTRSTWCERALPCTPPTIPIPWRSCAAWAGANWRR